MFGTVIKHRSFATNLCSLLCKRGLQNESQQHSVNCHRRVVITGLGLLTPLGIGVQQSWSQLIAAQSGIVRVKNESEYKDIPCKVAAYVPELQNHLEQFFNKSQLRTYSRASLYALLAAREAVQDANWKLVDDNEAMRSGVAIGSGMVSFEDILSAGDTLRKDGYGRVSPHFITKVLLNLPAGHVSMELGLRGPNHTVSTACTTGANAIGDAFNFIRYNAADVMLCGGVEAPINPLSLTAFCRIRALCTKYNDDPPAASRPFDQNRCGFVMGEGAGIMLLEELEHAKRRNAKIYGEILGYGLSGDASHVTAPREDGQGALSCMRNALADGHLNASDVEHINCHATSTPLGDRIELEAINQLFAGVEQKCPVTISSTKSSIGHLLGASGAVEAIFALLACQQGVLPPTLNLINPLDSTVNISAGQSLPWSSEKRVALSNSFGFGGTNASLLITNYIASQ